MQFTKEELKNMINMLKSSDKDNKNIVFGVLENIDFDKNIGEICILYRYGDYNLSSWAESSKLYEFILNNFELEGTKKSTGELLSIMTKHKCSKLSIELFIELFIKNMTRILAQMGYPTDKFEININIKEDGQTTES